LIFYPVDEGTGFSETSVPLFRLHGVTSHKRIIYIFTAVRTLSFIRLLRDALINHCHSTSASVE
jgi:hypothetical protein